MGKYPVIVVGGGAAGICAAISAGRRHERVIICEKMSRLGKKILASGNGRCNLLNEDLDARHYNPAARKLVRSVFERQGKAEILDFFQGLGLQVYSREGRIFPVTNQASSVLGVLEMELKKLSIPVEYNFDCSSISFSQNSIMVSSKAGKTLECRKVILSGGGKTYPAYGSDGSLYEIAAQMGHSLIEPVPSGVPLVVKDNLCFLLQGQRISAAVKSVIEGRAGDVIEGELLFTRYGLSGNAILDASEDISVAINRHKKQNVFLSVDMAPFLDLEQLKAELKKRKKNRIAAEEMLVGILPNKFGIALQEVLSKLDFDFIVNSLKDRRFKVSGTRGWNEAEFTSGGIDVNEVDPQTLESKIKKGVYLAGEILDVNGKCGGYNLGWAWASGLIAGQTG